MKKIQGEVVERTLFPVRGMSIGRKLSVALAFAIIIPILICGYITVRYIYPGASEIENLIAAVFIVLALFFLAIALVREIVVNVSLISAEQKPKDFLLSELARQIRHQAATLEQGADIWHKTYREMLDSKGLVESIVNSIEDSLMVIDEDERITWLNRAAVELLGYKEEELVGKPLSIVLSDELELSKTLKDYDTFYLTKSEERIPVSFSSSALYDSSGKSIGTIVTAKDVREKKQLVKELREAKEELERRVLARTRELAQVKDFQENIIMSMTDGLIVFSSDGRIREMNLAAQRLLGYSESELKGKDMGAITGSGEDITLLSGESDASSYEIKYISKTGEEIPVSVRSSQLHDRDGMLIGILTIARDMRERLLSEAKMREASRMTALGQFAAGAAHEINNPLSIISGNAQYLTEKLLGIEGGDLPAAKELREGLDLIHRYALSCSSIIQRLLTFSRGMNDTPENKIVDVNLAINDTLAVLEPQFKLSRIKLERCLSSGQLPVFGNLSQLQQVFMNILLNAREAIGENGHISVITKEVTAEGSRYIHIEVKDDGEGISSEDLPKVFDPFFTTKKPGAGTGLGLSVVYSIVREMKGTVDISSEKEKGATVMVRLPARQ